MCSSMPRLCLPRRSAFRLLLPVACTQHRRMICIEDRHLTAHYHGPQSSARVLQRKVLQPFGSLAACPVMV